MEVPGPIESSALLSVGPPHLPLWIRDEEWRRHERRWGREAGEKGSTTPRREATAGFVGSAGQASSPPTACGSAAAARRPTRSVFGRFRASRFLVPVSGGWGG